MSCRFPTMACAGSIVAPVNFQAHPDCLFKEAFHPKRCSLCTGRPQRCLQVKAILSNQKAPNDYGNEKSTSERTRVALERLFAQSQKVEQGSDISSEKKKFFDLDIASVEIFVEKAVEALRTKEELRAAEINVKAEEQKLEHARFALLQRERKLEVASHVHGRIKEELILAKERSAEQAIELKKIKEALSQREKEVVIQQARIDHKIEELGAVNREMLQKEASLAEAHKEMEVQNKRLNQSRDFISKQASQLGGLRNALEEQEKSLAFTEKQKRLQQDQLSKAEAELEQQALGWLKAQGQLNTLKQDLTFTKSNKELTEKQFEKCENLLSQVRAELDFSQKEIQKFRAKLKVQEMENGNKDEEICSYRLLLSSLEKELLETQKKLHAEKKQHNITRESYLKLRKEWDEGKHQVLDMKEKLEEQKQELRTSLEEVHKLRIDLQRKDSGLSDTQLLLQIKEAELVSAKMEMQQLSSEYSLNQLLLKDKTVELESAQEQQQLLQNEAFKLSTNLQAKESQLAKATWQLNEKEGQLKSMMATLDNRTVRLLEVTSVIKDIASLSQTLANAASPSIAAAQKGETCLMQVNYKLFTASRENLEKDIQILHLKKKLELLMKELEAEQADLEALKNCLKIKDIELLEAQRNLSDKEKQLNKIIRSWEVREAELKSLRQQVTEEANGLLMLHTLAQTRSMPEGTSSAEVAIENLQLESAKLDEETALCALQSLAELGEELVLAEKHKPEESIVQEVVLEKSTCNQLTSEAMTEKLMERESALEATKNAVENLLKLTMSLTNGVLPPYTVDLQMASV